MLLMKRHPGRVPVMVTTMSSPLPTKTKFLVPKDMPLGTFSWVLRTYLKQTPSSTAIFLAIHQTLPPVNRLMGDLHHQYSGVNDHILQVRYELEDVFG